MQTMMNSPEFLQQMSSMLSNPQVMDQVIAANPQLAQMGPQIREPMNNPMFREMMYVLSVSPPHGFVLIEANAVRIQTIYG